MFMNISAGQHVQIDDEDFAELSRHKWSFHRMGYAFRIENMDGEHRAIMMHRQIMGDPYCKNGKDIDHRNRAIEAFLGIKRIINGRRKLQ